MLVLVVRRLLHQLQLRCYSFVLLELHGVDTGFGLLEGYGIRYIHVKFSLFMILMDWERTSG